MTAFIDGFERFLKIIIKAGVVISAVSIFIMMVIIVVDVFMRNVLGTPLAGTYEIVENYLMQLAIFPSLAYTYQSGVIPQLTELLDKLPERFRKFNQYVPDITELVIFTLLFAYGFKFALNGLNDSMHIPISGNLYMIYPVYFVAPLGFGLILLFVILSILKRTVNEENGSESSI